MNSQPLVSILIPVYQREDFISEAIESALDQSFTDFEIIVVDNASADNTWKICQEMANSNSRIKIFRNNKNLGPVRNWQKCFEYATGKYAKILWSDDLMMPEFLAKAIPMIENEDVAFVYTTTKIAVNLTDDVSDSYVYGNTGLYSSSKFINDLLYDRNVPVSPGCAIFRLQDLRNNLVCSIDTLSTNDFKKNGAGPDLLLFLLISLSYSKIGFINEPLSFFREHGNSISILMDHQKLINQYQQARIWFTEKYLDKTELIKLLSSIWISDIYQSRKWKNPKNLYRQFWKKLPSVSYWYASIFICAKIRDKFLRFLKRVK